MRLVVSFDESTCTSAAIRLKKSTGMSFKIFVMHDSTFIPNDSNCVIPATSGYSTCASMLQNCAGLEDAMVIRVRPVGTSRTVSVLALSMSVQWYPPWFRSSTPRL